MSKKSRRRQMDAPSRKRKGRSGDTASLAIPVIVGLVVVAIIVGAILSIENRRPATAAVPGDLSVPVVTAQAQPTLSIPYPNVPRISLQETAERLEKGELVLVDVRSKDLYSKGHAKGAISIPEEEIEARLGELPRDKDVVFYCT